LVNKNRLEELAIFGGGAAFDEKLHVGRPNVGNREHLLTRINDLLDRRWLTNNGPYVQEFESKLSEMMDVKHCVAVCNATVGLEIACKAAGLTGEVIVPSFTFIATAHALQWQEITPVFCDVGPRTHNIDPCQVEQMVTPRTTGIIGVHVWGQPCDVEALTEIAHRQHLKLLFDAAHGFGCSYKGRMIGNFGDAEVFSFHATKFFNTFEGGAVVTNDDELAAKARLMRNFGFAGYDLVASIGTNAKMNEVSAAMGLTSFENLEQFVSTNYSNYKYYQRLADLPGISLVTYDETEKCNYQYIVLEIDEAVTRISRDQLQEVLWAENVLARRYFYPGCHRVEPYRSRLLRANLSLPNTERLAERVLCLPTGTAVGSDSVEAICRIIELAVTHGLDIQERLAHRPPKESVHSSS
jgi:dTDP-4-amino-4,6-dideoxygalactose transaminase